MTASDAEEAAYAKVTRRLIPFLFLCYVVAYLDRVNVGFAKLQMLADLQLSETAYGLGAGIFFIGYFLFEVPSNIIMHRVGARRWIARIMMSWGVLSSATMFVRTPGVFYATRFVLGVVEAGFFPGIILYLTYWYPPRRRARMTALFMTAIPVTGVIGSPISGLIMQRLAGANGWAGWQWLFLLEGVPSVVCGALAFFLLDDGIAHARWLGPAEKDLLSAAIARASAGREDLPLLALLRSGRVWTLALVYFCLILGLYGVSFWLPSLVRGAGVSDPLDVGLLTAVPYTAAGAAMVLVSRSADVRNERRWHIAVPAACGAAGLVASTLTTGSTGLAIAALTVATAGILSALPGFWSLPTSFLGGAAAAAGIALVNAIGNLAGFVSPYLVGHVKDVTRSTDAAMYVLAAALALAAVIVIKAVPDPR